MKRLAAAALIFAALSGCNTALTSRPSVPVQAGSVAVSDGFTVALNALRTSQGVGAVQQNASLTRAAQAHATDMARRSYLSHQARGGPNGNTFQQRARASGCAMRAGAENIAAGQGSETEVLNSWTGSPGHRRNMLASSYTQYGLGRSGNIWVLKLAAAC